MYRDISDFKKSYHPRTNIVNDEKGDIVTDLLVILARWRNHFSQQLNIHGINGVRKTEILVHTAEPIVPEFEMAIEKLRSHKSSGIDQIPAEMIEAGDKKNSP